MIRLSLREKFADWWAASGDRDLAVEQATWALGNVAGIAVCQAFDKALPRRDPFGKVIAPTAEVLSEEASAFNMLAAKVGRLNAARIRGAMRSRPRPGRLWQPLYPPTMPGAKPSTVTNTLERKGPST